LPAAELTSLMLPERLTVKVTLRKSWIRGWSVHS
jgi:hypothetical protein